jgi:hypothetical protein
MEAERAAIQAQMRAENDEHYKGQYGCGQPTSMKRRRNSLKLTHEPWSSTCHAVQPLVEVPPLAARAAVEGLG